MKKQSPPIFLFFLWFFVGILLGYYGGSEYSFKKYIQTPYTNQEQTIVSCDALTHITPVRNAKITSPLTVSVTVDNTKHCKWTVFEAQAGTITLKDTTGKILGTGTLQTSGDWMSTQPVTYSGTITFSKPRTTNVNLTIQEENPSGKKGQTIIIPLMY